MKYRCDFVTNSSSTSFAAAAGSIIAAILTALGIGFCAPDEEPETETCTLQVRPSRLTLLPGQSASLDVTVYQTGPEGDAVADGATINLSATSADLDLSPSSGEGELTVSVQASDSAAAGDYVVTVSAEADRKRLSRTVSVRIEPAVELELTYPVGRSPKVFVKGWVFGARCLVNPGTPDEKDLSDTVRWSGTGSFSPETGSQSRPSFDAPGANVITLTCEYGNEVIQKDFTVEAVSTARYARQGDKAQVPADSHGCPGCPHAAIGPIMAGSSLVLIDGRPAARVGDPGVHAACCGPNTFTITEGDPEVLIEGRRAAKIGDATQHCGGTGRIIEGSPG
ncbi:MAG: PAAR domain-containing protein [Bacillota bacterium]|nr:PAAR domain-containing protein [Bacillota bacterium]